MYEKAEIKTPEMGWLNWNENVQSIRNLSKPIPSEILASHEAEWLSLQIDFTCHCQCILICGQVKIS